MKKDSKQFPYFYVFVLLILIVLFLTGFLISLSQQNKHASPINFTGTKPESNLVGRRLVHISGEIKNPGVYEFKEDMRLAEIIELAGGLTENADKQFVSEKLNLAQKLKDEQKIYIPSVALSNNNNKSINASNISNLININTASLDELDRLPGIGPATAQKIIDARPFESIEELLDVSGIGEAKYNDIVNLITI